MRISDWSSDVCSSDLPCGITADSSGRGVAQPGRALSSGGRGRRFESSLPDQKSKYLAAIETGAATTNRTYLVMRPPVLDFPLVISRFQSETTATDLFCSF